MFKKNQIDKKILIILLSIFFLFSLVGCQFFTKPNVLLNKIENQEPLVNQEIEEKVGRSLDGLAVEKGKENLLSVAVVLENMPGAPKPTIADASIIYELPVEGGFTRFLAFFDPEELPKNLGPIRSARPYFAEIAEEYKSLFIHAGGSNDVLFKLKQGFYQLFNLDEISWMGKYFYRTNELGPHNLYIKEEKILKFLEDSKIKEQADFSPWLFNDEKSSSSEDLLERQNGENIKINFSTLYQVKWQYNKENNEYQYWQNSRVYKNKEGQEIKMKNLIIQYTDITVIDSEGRRKIKLTGQGDTLIFQNGQIIKGKWLKEASRTRFYNQLGQEITFLAGKTWVGIVSDKMAVSYLK